MAVEDLKNLNEVQIRQTWCKNATKARSRTYVVRLEYLLKRKRELL